MVIKDQVSFLLTEMNKKKPIFLIIPIYYIPSNYKQAGYKYN